MSVVICQECNDAPATTRRRFNGAALYDLCDGCAAHWDEHGLTTADEAPTNCSSRPAPAFGGEQQTGNKK